ncbi:MAG TPA: hypothetical protein VL522_25855 [Bordetella sp.]|jgi:hypothetical protein|nr:hypothetical protein [Bordetella sp.]
MGIKTMYWVSQILSWNYIDIAGRSHGRIDWFEDMRDIGYWWQTAYETGISSSIDRAKRGVEEAVMRRRMALEVRYLAGASAVQHVRADAPVDGGFGMEGEYPSGSVAWSA